MANSELAMHLHYLDNLLAAMLAVDDHVDLERLRTVAQHPAFASVHQTPLPQPALPQALPEPVFTPTPPPSGLSSVFGKKKHEAEVAHEYGKFNVVWQRWQQEASRIPTLQLEIMNSHQAAVADRAARLEADWQTYRNECAARERDVQATNSRLDQQDVVRANDGEVAVVDSRDVGDVQTFGRGDDRGIYRAQGQAAVARDEFGDTQPVAGCHWFDREGTAGEISEKPDFRFGPEACREQVDDFGDDQDRDDEWAGMCFKKLQCSSVIGVVGVYVGVQRSGVNDDRGYRATSAARISSIRSETSLRPLCPAPAAPKWRRVDEPPR
jgi:hypothetical protein